MTIKPGDLVMVVKPSGCCGQTHSLGAIFQVIDVSVSGAHCPHCGRIIPPTLVAWDSDATVVTINRLKRIDPLSEPESIVEAVSA